MKTQKVGSLFLVSILALAGIGISYAGFTDTLYIFGEVNTATVSLEVEDYSATHVYKMWGKTAPTEAQLESQFGDIILEYNTNEEVLILRGFVDDLPTEAEVTAFFVNYPCEAELVSQAYAEQGSDPYDIHMVYDNLFPCKYFTADFVLNYTGSIPAKLWADITTTDSWLLDLAAAGEIEIKAYDVTWDGSTWIKGDMVDIGHQVHNGDHVYIELTIHLPQDNKYQGKTGSFTAHVTALQWNEHIDDVNIPWPIVGIQDTK